MGLLIILITVGALIFVAANSKKKQPPSIPQQTTPVNEYLPPMHFENPKPAPSENVQPETTYVFEDKGDFEGHEVKTILYFRKDVNGWICPNCETQNQYGTDKCFLCYYDRKRS